MGGGCNCCGQCCETPTIPINPILFYFKSVRWVVIKWQDAVNGFEFKGENRFLKHLVFRCRHWDTFTKRCHVYHTRPGMCRDYPRNLLDDAVPEFLEGCGYYPVLRNAQKMRDALVSSGLPDEKVKELAKMLHLDHDQSP
jgi:Fe-S-cluster containining protein